jgi:hypothetical protein
VTILATASGALFAFADKLPATVPIVLALILIDWRLPTWVRPRMSSLMLVRNEA